MQIVEHQRETVTPNLLAAGRSQATPFRHVLYDRCISRDDDRAILMHLREHRGWRIRAIEDFYETYDLSVTDWAMPEPLSYYASTAFREALRSEIEHRFGAALRSRVDVMAQKMVAGQRIGVHTDFGPVSQSYRFLIQLNESWHVSNGGILLLLAEEKPAAESADTRFYVPVSGSGVAFEISQCSFHGVSRLTAGERYTLVYSFYRDSEPAPAS